MEAGAHLRETIESQPRVVADLLGDDAIVRSAASRIAGAARFFLVGTGTSFHGAMVGEHLFRSGGCEAWAVPAFEFTQYGPPFGVDDGLILISHRGTKRFSNAALDKFRKESRQWVVITGEGSPFEGDGVIRTVAQEKSAVHTASHTAAMVRLAQLARAMPTRNVPQWAATLSELPRFIESASALRDRVASLAAGLDLGRPIHFAGAGPAWSTALEGALKLSEASYVPAIGHELENFVHGPLVSIARGQTVIVITPQSNSLPRASEVVAALSEIGANAVTVGSAAGRADHASLALETPVIDELLAPIVNVVPLQWLAYEVARRVGVDPDPFRRNEPAYAAALEAAPL